MFFLAGISSKIKELGSPADAVCGVCGSRDSLHIINQYMTPHFFFIPTFRFGNQYLATCRKCASLMELQKDKGEALRRGERVSIAADDLHVVQDNSQAVCTQCGSTIPRGSSFCNYCGARIL